MNIKTWNFVFHPPAHPFSEYGSWYSIFGHVEAFGQTKDGTWLFFDPQGRQTKFHITHHRDEVDDLLDERYQCRSTIISIPSSKANLIFPYRGPMTCVTQCAAIMGWRAYTPGGFRRKLLQNGGTIIHEQREISQSAKGKRGIQA